MSWSTSEIRGRWVPLNLFKTSSNKYFYWPFQDGASFVDFLLFMFRVCHAVLSVYCSLVVICLERANLLALLCEMLTCVLSLSHLVSLVRCGTWMDQFLIFSFLLISSVVEVINIRTHTRKTNNLPNIYTTGMGTRNIIINKWKIYYFKIKIIPLNINLSWNYFIRFGQVKVQKQGFSIRRIPLI